MEWRVIKKLDSLVSGLEGAAPSTERTFELLEPVSASPGAVLKSRLLGPTWTLCFVGLGWVPRWAELLTGPEVVLRGPHFENHWSREILLEKQDRSVRFLGIFLRGLKRGV